MGVLDIPQFEEEDEDGDDSPVWSRTEEVCASCGEAICFTDEVYLVQMAQGQQVPNIGPEIYIVLDDEGDFLYSPHFIHLECWEDITDEVLETVRDMPPETCNDGVLDCCLCASDILAWEFFVTATLGEMEVSDRQPDGEGATKFRANGNPDIYCLACIVRVNEEELELWNELTQAGECSSCIQERCWRYSRCDCRCHEE
jgi:hypothetical protein